MSQHFIKYLRSFIPLLLIFALTGVRADLITPPRELITPFSIGILLVNFLINLVVFGIAYLLFVNDKIENLEDF